ncbi:MAG: spore maturation protein [Clostridiales bacterium]|nr:spore maturation protein [Clostridiales bacterium]
MQVLQILLIPLLLLWLLVAAAWKRMPVYDLFLIGSKEGLQVALRVLPNLAAMMVAIGMFRVSGCLDALTDLCTPVFQGLGLPPEIAPLAMMRPLSGSASLGMVEALITRYGPDSRVGLVACTVMGSSETIFYTICVYLGAIKHKRSGYAIPCALLGALAALVLAGVFF